MRRVNIYAEADTATFRKMGRWIGYVLELVDIEGATVATCEGWLKVDATWNEAILKAFIEALSRMNRHCEVHLYTQNKVILDMIDNNLDTWKKTGYRNTKGNPIRNAQLWENLAERCTGHLIIPEEGVHPYYHWMLDKMKREKNKGTA